jgi:hypothetical protein
VKAITTNELTETKPVPSVKLPVTAVQQISVVFTAEAAFKILICQGKINFSPANKFSTNVKRISLGDLNTVERVHLGNTTNTTSKNENKN